MRIFLPPRRGALNLAVRFNARYRNENDLFVASATVESATTSEFQKGFNRRRRDENPSHAAYRGLKPHG
jgi:hypothetical protein